jgi:hypothetical protein
VDADSVVDYSVDHRFEGMCENCEAFFVALNWMTTLSVVSVVFDITVCSDNVVLPDRVVVTERTTFFAANEYSFVSQVSTDCSFRLCYNWPLNDVAHSFANHSFVSYVGQN